MAPSGLQPSPFDSVTPSSTVVMVPSGSRRYSAPPPGRTSYATVPAQNRPAGSHAPSLKRTSSGMSAGRQGPASLRPPGFDVDPGQAGQAEIPDRPFTQLGFGLDHHLPRWRLGRLPRRLLRPGRARV